MATMVPSRYDTQASSAERRIFDRFQADPNTKDWTVLHSLALSRRGRKPYGEVDFVVLVPEGGVVCLEVKGGRVSCSNGIWQTEDRNGRIAQLNRSPFQQAREGMFELRTTVHRKFNAPDELASAMFSYAVIFPDVESPPGTTEFETWECIDVRSLRQPISRNIMDVVRGQRARLGKLDSRISKDSLRRLRNFLRPDFERVVSRSTTIARSEERVLRLTEEQFEVVDSVERNHRCLVEGAAGTGKTLLALELARRSAESGCRTVLLCFNRMLGDWFHKQTSRESTDDVLLAGSYHRVLRKLILQSSYSAEFSAHENDPHNPKLFDELYPFYGELALNELVPADVIVVDEAQDLARSSVLAVLNAWLRGGFAGGRWAMFGDFTRQSLYAADGGAVNEDLQPMSELAAQAPARQPAQTTRPPFKQLVGQSAPHFTTLLLRRNCRNTRPIGEETALLSGFEALPYRLDSQQSLPVDYRWWHEPIEEARLLEAILGDLVADGVKLSDIVILSRNRFERSAAVSLARHQRHPVAPIAGHGSSDSHQEAIVFSTIHAFKGMESPVVILCGFDRIDDAGIQSLLYVGMSRARSHLIMLLHDSARKAVQRAVLRRLLQGWET